MSKRPRILDHLPKNKTLLAVRLAPEDSFRNNNYSKITYYSVSRKIDKESVTSYNHQAVFTITIFLQGFL